MGSRSTNSKENSSPRLRMGEYSNGGQEEFNPGEGSLQDGGPRERFARALQGVGERSLDEGSIPEKPSVEVYHSQKLLESRFIHGQRKIPDGGDVFEERTEAY